MKNKKQQYIVPNIKAVVVTSSFILVSFDENTDRSTVIDDGGIFVDAKRRRWGWVRRRNHRR